MKEEAGQTGIRYISLSSFQKSNPVRSAKLIRYSHIWKMARPKMRPAGWPMCQLMHLTDGMPTACWARTESMLISTGG